MMEVKIGKGVFKFIMDDDGTMRAVDESAPKQGRGHIIGYQKSGQVVCYDLGVVNDRRKKKISHS